MIGEDPDLETDETFTRDHRQEEEMEASKEEVLETKGDEVEKEVAIEITFVGATPVRGEVKAEEGTVMIIKIDLQIGMNMLTW